MSEKILVNATDAASMLSMGRSTFFRKVSEGLLPAPVRFGGVTRWRVDDLRAMTLQAFCDRHGCSIGAASQRRAALDHSSES